MILKPRFQGFNTHRLASNPLEAKFAMAWQTRCEGLPHHITTGLVVRSHKVVASVAQWLGSPVGEAFVRDELDKERPSFAQAWERQNKASGGPIGGADTLDYILHRGDQRHVVKCSDRHRDLARYFMQWLDMPDGRTFLQDTLKSPARPRKLKLELGT